MKSASEDSWHGTDPFARACATLGVAITQAPRVTPMGQQRTAYVTSTDGRDLVVKLLPTDAAPRIQGVVDRVETLRGRGWPAAGTLAHGLVPSDEQRGEQSGGRDGLGHESPTYGWIQQRLPGGPCAYPDDAMLDEILAAVELQAGVEPRHLLAGHETRTSQMLYEDAGEGWRTTAQLGGADARAAARLRDWLRGVPTTCRTGDYVHQDFHFDQLLAEPRTRRLTGIVDYDYVSCGDRASDLAYLAVMGYANLAYDAAAGELPPQFFLLRDAARSISGETGWRQGVARAAVTLLSWRGADGAGTEPLKAARITHLVLDVHPRRDRMAFRRTSPVDAPPRRPGHTQEAGRTQKSGAAPEGTAPLR